jgi:hypothetical protein
MPFGDFDDDGDVDLDDYESFVPCYTGAGGGPLVPGCEPADSDLDDDVDCEDWDRFLREWTGPGLPPGHPQCTLPIPAVSEWGVIIMILLLLVSGTIVFEKRLATAQRVSPS